MTDSVFLQRCRLVMQKLDETRLASGLQTLGDNWGSSRSDLASHADCPRVTWIRGGGKVTPFTTKTHQLTSDGRSLQALYSAEGLVAAHIIGATDADTEQLHCDVIEAVHLALGHRATPGTFSWATQEDGASGLAFGGRELVIQIFTWPTIIFYDEGLVTTITSESHTGRLADTVGC